MSISTKDLIDLIIRPTLTGIGLGGEAAIQLLAGTCAIESAMGNNLKQIVGPALGIFMVEPKTHEDIHRNYLRFHPDLASLIYKISGMPWNNIGTIPFDEELVYNLRYSACMARLKYYRNSKALPGFNDINSQANYWKDIYNTENGKGIVAGYLITYDKYLKSYYND
jgi:hypothetical protein